MTPLSLTATEAKPALAQKPQGEPALRFGCSPKAAVDAASYASWAAQWFPDEYVAAGAGLTTRLLRSAAGSLEIQGALESLETKSTTYNRLLAQLAGPNMAPQAQNAAHFIESIQHSNRELAPKDAPTSLLAGAIEIGSSVVGFERGMTLASLTRWSPQLFRAGQKAARALIHGLLPKPLASRCCSSPRRILREESRANKHQRRVLAIHRKRIAALKQPQVLQIFDALVKESLGPKN